MSIISSAEANQVWSDFLQRWPLESLESLTLQEYSLSGNTDTLTYWLESITEDLGSIWGGSAFKFGIYSRKDKTPKSGDKYTHYSDEYAWTAKYGETPEAAFAKVKGIIISIAKAARLGDLQRVDAADLGTVTKWKIAFLYQDRKAPSVLPVYLEDSLRLASGMGKSATPGEMHSVLMAKRGAQDVIDYGREVWQKASALAAQRWSAQRVLDILAEDEDFTPVKAATAKIAGFQTKDGRQLAVDLSNKKPSLFLEPGDWQAKMAHQLPTGTNYPAEKTRHSGLDANAPRLSLGHVAVHLMVPNEEVLRALLGAFVDSECLTPEQAAKAASREIVCMSEKPLNQILFGPPGTGKTYATVEAALQVLDSRFLQENGQDRGALKQRFDQLVEEGRIRFVTFHQSFSYEDFVEGLRAETDETSGQLRYAVVDGVFKSLCEVASTKVTQQAEAPVELGGRKIWKMSLGNTLGSDASIYEECIQGGYMLLGYGGSIDFSECKTRSDVQQRFADAGVALEGTNDYSLTSVATFVTKMKVGDLVVVSDGNYKFRAIGEITGDYVFKPHADYEDGYAQMRPVKWLRQYSPSLPHGELLNAQFSQMTLYELRSPTLNREKLKTLLGTPEVDSGSLLHVGQSFGQGYVVRSIGADVVEFDKPRGGVLPLPLSLLRQLLAYVRSGQIDVEDIRQGRVFEKVAEAELEKYIVNGYQSLFAAMVEQLLKPQASSPVTDARVLIIDEINRGNVSRIFGELITLIEPSKRAGADEALSVVLPYSKKPFSVPSNVYLVGTMNTADRSLSGLDIALRRRFTFVEMPPKPELLDDVLVEDVNIGQLLRVMNQRIEILLDRDHCLGHAYFIPLKTDPRLELLGAIFRNQIMPLLQEYFFEDWQRIAWVLNDQRATASMPFLRKPESELSLTALFGHDVKGKLNDQRWELNDRAFGFIDSYRNILG